MAPRLGKVISFIAAKRQAREGRGEGVDLRIAQRLSLALHQGNARAILKRLPLTSSEPGLPCRLPSVPEDAEQPEDEDSEWEWDSALETPPSTPTA